MQRKRQETNKRKSYRNNSFLWLTCIALVFKSFSPTVAWAVTLELPDGINYEIPWIQTDLQQSAVSYLKTQTMPSGVQRVVRSGQRGFIALSRGKPPQPREEGELYIAVISSADEASLLPKDLSVTYQSQNPGREHLFSLTHEILTPGVNTTQNYPGTIGGDIPVQSNETPMETDATTDIAGSTTPHLNAPDRHVLMVKIPSIAFGSVDTMTPVVTTDQVSFRFNSGDKALPQNNTLVILHFVLPGGRDHLIIHTEKGNNSDPSKQSYTLSIKDLSHLSALAPVATFKKLARAAKVQEIDIEAADAAGFREGPKEASYTLLITLRSKVPDLMQSESLATLCEREGAMDLAKRIRQKQLQITDDDQDLQQQMHDFGKHIDLHAAVLAGFMGLPDTSIENIKQSSTPGYQLLRTAYVANRLGKLHSASQSMGLEELLPQITKMKLNLLASAIEQQAQDTSLDSSREELISLQTIAINDLPEEILDAEISCLVDLGNTIMSKGSQEQWRNLVDSIHRQAGVDTDPGESALVDIVHMARSLYGYKQDVYDGLLTYRKFLDILNNIRTLPSLSAASRIINGLIEKQLGPKNQTLVEFAGRARKRGDRAAALRLLALRGFHDKPTIIPKNEALPGILAHGVNLKGGLGIQCEDGQCIIERQGATVRRCSHLPSLAKAVSLLPSTAYPLMIPNKK